MLRMGFKPMTPLFERVKTVLALDSVTTMIGPIIHIVIQK
jgi:hypothetical protein